MSRVRSDGITKGLAVSRVRSNGITRGLEADGEGIDWGSRVGPTIGGVTKGRGDVLRVRSDAVTKGLAVSWVRSNGVTRGHEGDGEGLAVLRVRSNGVTKGHEGGGEGMDWANLSR